MSNNVVILQLRGIANVSGYPQSVSSYQYLSSAVRKDNLPDVYHKYTGLFFSYMFVLPSLAIIAYAIVILSKHEAIKKQMMKPEKHQDFAALICLGLTLSWYTTILDIFAVAWLDNEDHTTEHIYYSKENHKNDRLKYSLIASIVVELIICCLGEIWSFIFIFCQWYYKEKEKWEKEEHWSFLLFLFIPPIWCLPSHFGFIILAWSSFARHSKSLTLLYIFAITMMLLVMRQSYKLIVDIYYYATLDNTSRKDKQKADGILVWVILLVRVVGVLLVGFFIYLMFGLWLLPVTELVEESPIYLYDSLQLIIVVLAILVSYELISFREEKIVKLLEEIKNGGSGVPPVAPVPPMGSIQTKKLTTNKKR